MSGLPTPDLRWGSRFENVRHGFPAGEPFTDARLRGYPKRHVNGAEARGVEAGGSGEKQRARLVPAVGDDDEFFDAKNFAGPDHRIVRAEACVVQRDGIRGHAARRERVTHGGWLVVFAPGTGDAFTKDEFGPDVQLHIEFATPNPPSGNGQERGNSGVFLFGRYEIQVLDNYENQTYPDGQATAIYGYMPPLVNACRKPGEWQTYDIIFEGPRFNADGTVAKKAIAAVLHNGVVTQNHTELIGDTPHQQVGTYHKHPEKGHIRLQDHGNPMRFRNIWVRELKPVDSQ